MTPYVPDPLADVAVGAAIEVHRALGPGLLESAYQRCLAHELMLRKIAFTQQVPVPVRYKGLLLDCSYRVDFILGNKLLLELKSCDRLLPIHHAQVLTYLKLLNIRHGLLLNFNAARVTESMKSFVL